jgi:hypothetical protein
VPEVTIPAARLYVAGVIYELRDHADGWVVAAWSARTAGCFMPRSIRPAGASSVLSAGPVASLPWLPFTKAGQLAEAAAGRPATAWCPV